VIDEEKIGAFVPETAVGAGEVVPPENGEPITGGIDGGPEGLKIKGGGIVHINAPYRFSTFAYQ
jgi:hypothetical protein